MIGDRKLQKSIRRIVLARIRSSPTLSKEYWRARGGVRYYFIIGLAIAGFLTIAPLVLILLPALAGVGMAQANAGGPVIASICAMVSAAIAIGHASWLTRELIASRTLAVATQLPLSDGELVRNRTRGSLILTVLFLVASLSYFGGVIGGGNLTPMQSVSVAGLAVLQWMMVASCSIVIPAWFPRLARPEVVRLLVALTATAHAISGVGAALNLIAAEHVAIVGLAVLPTGWVLMILYFGILNPVAGMWWLLVPIGIMPILAGMSYGRIRRRYRLFEISLADTAFATAVFENPAAVDEDTAPEFVAGTEKESHESLSDAEPGVSITSPQPGGLRERLRVLFGVEDEPEELELTAAEASNRVRSRAFIEPVAWSERGLIERIVGSVLSDRECRVAEVLLGGPPKWTRRLLPVLGITLALLALLVLGHFLFNVHALTMCWQLAIATAGFSLQGSWPAAIWRCSTGQVSSPMGLIPATDREVTRAAMVLGTARCVVLLPYVVVLAGALSIGLTGRLDFLLIAVVTGKMLLTYAALHQWWFVAVQPSTSSQRLIRQLFESMLIVALMLSAVGGMLWLYFAGMSQIKCLMAATLMFTSGWLAQRLHRRRFLTQPIDFITMRHSELQQMETRRREKINRQISW